MTIHSPSDFEAFYVGGLLPWDIGRPQTVFLRLAEAGLLRGRVLDVGCGTGEHALMAAAIGLEATGVDIAPTAIEKAKVKGTERGLDVRFVVGDALDLSGLGETYDNVLDCGVFHVFDDDDRARFVASLRGVITSGGRYRMLCFSDKQPGDFGPRRVTEEEIRTSFAVSDGWRIESIEPATLEITRDPNGARAWIAEIERL